MNFIKRLYNDWKMRMRGSTPFSACRGTLAIAIFLSLLTGCQKYGEVSEQTYEVAGALYTACNLKSDERIAAVRSTIEDDAELQDREKQWLLGIVAVAESGEWEKATAMARRMMDEQVKSD